MKKSAPVITIIFLILAASSLAMRNPAAVNCEKQGFDYEINETKDGERGLCIISEKMKLDAWKLLSEQKKDFSSCEECSEKIQVSSFESYLINEKLDAEIEKRNNLVSSDNATEYFNWRDYNGRNWISPVKDQGGCGSCWAFSAVGVVESTFNINQNDSRLNPDLSEQYLVSDCYPDYDCNGGWHDEALDYTKFNGISDENCFEYLASNSACNRCSNWDERIWAINDYYGTWNNYAGTAQMKEWLVNYGPLSVVINVSAWSSTDYTCKSSSGVDHAVVIVGYNDTGGYWLIKNSWGTGFGDNGYFKIKYNNCNINYFVFYIDTVSAPNFKPTITLNSPAANFSANKSTTSVLLNFTSINKASQTSTCDIYVNSILKLTNSSVNNNTPSLYTLDTAEENYQWHVKCFENSIGIMQQSETRAFQITNQAPNITAYYPAELTINIAEPQNQTFNITYSDAEGDNLTARWWQNNIPVANSSTYNFTGSYSSAGTYSIIAVVSDSSSSTNITWTLIVNNTAVLPQFYPLLENKTMLEDSSLSYQINTTFENAVSYSVDNSNFSISAIGLLTYTPAANWYGINWLDISARDNATQISEIIFVNVTPVNDAPAITGLADIAANESALVDINASGALMISDVDDAVLTAAYSSPLNASGQWKTNSSSAGIYQIFMNVSDRKVNTTKNITLAILDAVDSDNDGISDWLDSDDDNDGIPDAEDYMKGNASSISLAGISEIRIFVNNSGNLARIINTTTQVNFSDGEKTLIEFNHTFSANSILDLTNITYIKNITANSVLVYGLELTERKNIYLDNTSQKNSVCIKDAQILSFSQISANCSGASEILVPCPGEKNNYECIIEGSRLKITNLQNSAIMQMNDILPPAVTALSASNSGTNPITVTLSATTDETAECRHNTTDANLENMTKFSSTNRLSHQNTFAYSSDSSGIYYVRCNDAYGNIMQSSSHVSYSADVTEQSSSSSSSSGSSSSSSSSSSGGGGAALSSAEDTGKKAYVLFNLEAGKEYVLSVSESNVPVTKIFFSVDKSISKMEFRISSTAAQEKLENAYRYFEIKATDSVRDATIKFKVSSSWLGNYDPKSVKLFRYDGGWNALPTTQIDETTYSAETSGFSVFAVAAEKKIEKIIKNETQKNEKNSMGSITGRAADESEQTTERITAKEIVAFAFAIIMIFFVVKLLKKQSKEKHLNKKKQKRKK